MQLRSQQKLVLAERDDKTRIEPKTFPLSSERQTLIVWTRLPDPSSTKRRADKIYVAYL